MASNFSLVARCKRVGPACRTFHSEALLAKAVNHELGRGRIVFDDQNAIRHGPREPLTRAPSSGAYRGAFKVGRLERPRHFGRSDGEAIAIALGQNVRLTNLQGGRQAPASGGDHSWPPGREFAQFNRRGIVDMKSAILALAAASVLATAAPAFATDAGASARHDLYAAVQTKLKTDHLYSGPVDGRWTDQTEEALAIFQERHGLARTGRLAGPTKRALGV